MKVSTVVESQFCSLHFDVFHPQLFLNTFYKNRANILPHLSSSLTLIMSCDYSVCLRQFSITMTKCVRKEGWSLAYGSRDNWLVLSWLCCFWDCGEAEQSIMVHLPHHQWPNFLLLHWLNIPLPCKGTNDGAPTLQPMSLNPELKLRSEWFRCVVLHSNRSVVWGIPLTFHLSGISL